MQLDNYIFLLRLDSANYIQVKSLLFDIIKIFNITETKMYIYIYTYVVYMHSIWIHIYFIYFILKNILYIKLFYSY